MRKLNFKLLLPFGIAVIVAAMIITLSCSRENNPLVIDNDDYNASGAENPYNPSGINIDPSYAHELPVDSYIAITFSRYMKEFILYRYRTRWMIPLISISSTGLDPDC
jgi:hypothetical protein